MNGTNNNYWRLLHNYCISLSNIVLHLHFKRQNIFEGWANFFTFLCGPPKDFTKLENYIGAGANEHEESSVYSMNQQTPINIISAKCFQIKRVKVAKTTAHRAKRLLFWPRNINFYQNIWILSHEPVDCDVQMYSGEQLSKVWVTFSTRLFFCCHERVFLYLNEGNFLSKRSQIQHYLETYAGVKDIRKDTIANIEMQINSKLAFLTQISMKLL